MKLSLGSMKGIVRIRVRGASTLVRIAFSFLQIDQELKELRATFEKTRDENLQLLVSSAQLEERMKKSREK